MRVRGVAAAVLALALAAVPATASIPPDDPARGLVYAGLRAGRAGGPCAGAFEIATAAGVRCTHGPDPAPAGTDVRDGDAAVGDGPTAPSAPFCTPAGSEGPRVHVIYAVASDRTDRYDFVLPTIRDAIARVDSAFAASAAETGGTRLVRWLADETCTVAVDHVVLSPSGDDSFGETIDELASAGYTRADRKYVVFMDATLYCGIAELWLDDTPGASNANDAYTGTSRIDSGCWAGGTAAHELMHNIGGVQNSAPHASVAGHCTDEWDLMCYADGPGVVLTYPCAPDHAGLFDCGHDDYFHTSPDPGSYLATHWNAASSRWLVSYEKDSTPPVTDLELSGTPGDGGWWRSNVTATLACTDDLAGCEGSWARLDDEGSFSARAGVHVTGDGRHALEYYSRDRDGNAEDPRAAAVWIDRAAPGVTAVVEQAHPVLTAAGAATSTGGAWPAGQRVPVRATASDPTSGVAKVTFLVDGVAVLEDADGADGYAFTWDTTGAAPGTHVVSAEATDAAGWTRRHDVTLVVIG